MARGGYQKPSNPTPVSNPGSGNRTDGGPQSIQEIPGGKYGESKALYDMQAAIPQGMAGTATPTRKLPGIVSLTEKTQRPDEVPEYGMPFGGGAGPEAINMPSFAPAADRSLSQILFDVARNDPTGQTTEMAELLASRGM
jgi:hypothetical protein